jgi:C1A family cysteine protease
MRKFLWGLLMLSTSAFADPATVTIKGKTYSTGLLPRTKDMPAFYKSLTVRGELPESYDAREHGLVTPIKNQGNCGSCWSFARTKALEASAIIAGRSTSNALDMAEQDALVNDRNSYGCRGGFMDGRFEVTKGVTTEELCPYRTSDRYSCKGEKYAKATRWAMVGAANRAPTVDELRQAIIDYGVLAVTVAAGGSFSPNSSGRITTCGSRGINHMVTLAGYRPAPSGGYEFLIANSWGTNWGDGGFAWSKQGCNQLASTPGDAALFFYVAAE